MAGVLAPELWPVLGAGAVMLLLAVALLVLDFNHRLNRAFALFLVLRGTLNGLGALSQDPLWAALAERTAPYFHIALPFAALYFAWRYAQRYGTAALRARAPSRAPAALVAGAVLFEVAYALDHGLWSRGPRLEAFSVFVALKFLAYAAIALQLARDARRQPVGSRRGSTQLIALGFALSPAFLATKSVLVTLGEVLGPAGQDPRLAEPGYLGLRLTAVLTLAVLAWTAMQWRGQPEARRFLGALAVALASGVLVTAALALDPAGWGASLDIAADGLWTLALPVLVTFALLRHELFGLDLKVKATIRGSALLGVFVAVYFLASEGAESVVADNWGPPVGLAAAALLTLVQGPLQRGATRVADAAMPGVRPFEELSGDAREALYVAQVQAAAEDGALTAKDRRVLEVARQRLGLSPERAAALERDALPPDPAAPPAPRRGAPA